LFQCPWIPGSSDPSSWQVILGLYKLDFVAAINPFSQQSMIYDWAMFITLSLQTGVRTQPDAHYLGGSFKS